MLKKLTGYLFVAIGLIGYVFFKNYKGEVIPYASLCYILSIVIGIIGCVLIYKSKSSSVSAQEKYDQEILDRLKKNGERILLTIYNCEIRENNYYEEVISDSTSNVEAFDALYDPNRNYSQKYVVQSAIIYYHEANGKKNRMTSQSFFFSAEALKNYVQNRKVVLYINRFDKEEYIFEMIDR